MIYEIHGHSGSGKSMYALNKIKNENKLCLYVNADFQLLDNITNSSLYVLNSNDIYTIKESIILLGDSVDAIIIDSLPMINNKEENTDKVITEMQRIIAQCKRNKVDLYIINQYRMNNKDIEDYTYYLNRLRIYYNKRIKVGQ